MGLDIRFSSYMDVTCPYCGEIIGQQEANCVDSSGRGWYPILEEIRYYVPDEPLTDETDWYGKDMALTKEQTDAVYRFVSDHPELYLANDVKGLIAAADKDGATVVINADW